MLNTFVWLLGPESHGSTFAAVSAGLIMIVGVASAVALRAAAAALRLVEAAVARGALTTSGVHQRAALAIEVESRNGGKQRPAVGSDSPYPAKD